MKKSRLILACLVVAVALGGLTGCMLPDYQLDINLNISNSESTNGTWADVSYTLENVGSRDLTNVQVEFQVFRSTTIGYETGTIGPLTINTGNTSTGTIRVYMTAGGDGPYSFAVYVTSVGWDSDD